MTGGAVALDAGPTDGENARGRHPPAPQVAPSGLFSALACLETGIALADHEHLAAAPNDLAVTVPRLGGLQGGKDLHDAKPLGTGSW
jgi:hypothetical protein